MTRCRRGAVSTVYAGTKHAVRAISEGLSKEEAGNNIRSTIISSGAVTTELTNSITDMDLKPEIEKIYEDAIDAESIARAIAFDIEQPSDVAVNFCLKDIEKLDAGGLWMRFVIKRD